MFNIIVSIIYLRALLSDFKAAFQAKFGVKKSSNEDEEFYNEFDESDESNESNEDEIVTRYASDWTSDGYGINEAQFFIGQVSEGFILGDQVSHMGGDCDVSWGLTYYLNFEAAKSAIEKQIHDWIRGDCEETGSL